MERAMVPTAPPQDVKPMIRDSGTVASRGVAIFQQEIQVRAYHKWEAMGKPLGKDLKFWLEAQHELLQGK